MQTTLEMYFIMVKKVGHWNRAETLSPGSRHPTKSRERPSLLFQYTMTLIYWKEKEQMRPHVSLRQPHACSTHRQNMPAQTHTINNWFPQLVVSFHWNDAREDFCSTLIGESDIWDDCGHSPDQTGKRLGQKQSQSIHSEADVSISTTLHC